MTPENTIHDIDTASHAQGLAQHLNVPEEVLTHHPALREWNATATPQQKRTMVECWSSLLYKKPYMGCSKAERGAVWQTLSEDIERATLLEQHDIMGLFSTRTASNMASIVDTISTMRNSGLNYRQLRPHDRVGVWEGIAERMHHGMGLEDFVSFDSVIGMTEDSVVHHR